MRVSTLFYCLKQGVKNIGRNIWFSLASVATISACIFLFCLFFSILANVRHSVEQMETTVGITVFFDEALDEAGIQALGEPLREWAEIKDVRYTSAAAAWDDFQKEYFKGHEELAAGFAQDNPLAGSASYTLFLYDIATQQRVVEALQRLEGVRQVNYSLGVAEGFSSLNAVAGLLSGGMVLVLLVVAIFLISNTISVAAAFRKNENEIMRMIGATNFMIRMPFVVEGLMLGLFGAGVPLVGMYFLYLRSVEYIAARFQILVASFLPVQAIFPDMAVVALALGVGIGFVGSFFTIRKQLRV